MQRKPLLEAWGPHSCGSSVQCVGLQASQRRELPGRPRLSYPWGGGQRTCEQDGSQNSPAPPLMTAGSLAHENPVAAHFRFMIPPAHRLCRPEPTRIRSGPWPLPTASH